MTERSVSFHRKYGGANGVVDEPSEITPEMAADFSTLKTGDQREVLEDTLQARPKDAFLLLEKWSRELENRPPIYSRDSVSLVYSYIQAIDPSWLPHFVTISDQHQTGIDPLDRPECRRVDCNPHFLEGAYLLVAHEGSYYPIFLDGKLLHSFSAPAVKIDGFIKGAIFITRNDNELFEADDVRASEQISEEFTKPFMAVGLTYIPLPTGGGFRLVEYPNMPVSKGQLALFQSAASCAECHNIYSIGYFSYSFGALDHLQGASESGRFAINFGTKTNGETVVFEQNAAQKIAERNNIGIYSQDPAFEPDDHHDEISAVFNGVSRVNSYFGSGVVSRITIFPSPYYQAQAGNDRDLIFSVSLIKRDGVEAQFVSEHEALHVADKQNKFLLKPKIWEAFESLDKWYNCVLRRYNKALFQNFIEESNFFGLRQGGHPADDPLEFNASFLHTLLYPEKIEQNLSKYTLPEQLKILNCYQTLLEAYFAETEGQLQINFRHSLKFIKRLKSEISRRLYEL